jgi:hypothetical protein
MRRSNLQSLFVTGQQLRWRGELHLAGPRQHDFELCELPRLRLHFDSAAVLFHDDVMAHRQAKPGAFARGLGREERIEDLLFYFGRDSGAVVANANFDLVTEILRRGAQRWLETITGFGLAFSCAIESV